MGAQGYDRKGSVINPVRLITQVYTRASYPLHSISSTLRFASKAFRALPPLVLSIFDL